MSYFVGIHRSLAVSKVRSLRMDSKVWKPSIIQVSKPSVIQVRGEYWSVANDTHSHPSAFVALSVHLLQKLWIGYCDVWEQSVRFRVHLFKIPSIPPPIRDFLAQSPLLYLLGLLRVINLLLNVLHWCRLTCCLQLMMVIGNDNANKFWEWNMSQESKIDSNTDELVVVWQLLVSL